MSREAFKVSKNSEGPKWALFQNNSNNKLRSYYPEIDSITQTISQLTNIYRGSLF
uniref:Uncharacterized protein n=2 Tax=Macaca TaxID=9539 RepID=A0A2K6AMD6_MACNE|nr:unnamed protein product [Macaca fascicularis]